MDNRSVRQRRPSVLRAWGLAGLVRARCGRIKSGAYLIAAAASCWFLLTRLLVKSLVERLTWRVVALGQGSVAEGNESRPGTRNPTVRGRRNPRSRGEGGSIAEWVMILVMAVGITIFIWSVAQPLLGRILRTALSKLLR